MPNLAYEVAVRGGILPEMQDITPFAITLDRFSPNVDWKKLKETGVIVAYIEAGCLYNSVHMIQTYQNPKLKDQVSDAIKNQVPFGLYCDVKSKNIDEALQEIKELRNILRVYTPQVGVWLRLLFNNGINTNESIVNLYQKYLVDLGFKDQFGFYVTHNQLKTIDWNKYKDNWYLWLIDHDSNLEQFQDFYTPEFFMLDT